MSHYPQYPSSGTPYTYPGYHPQAAAAYAQTPGSYPTTPYQPYAPPTAVTSYGSSPWAAYHGYPYYTQQSQHQQQHHQQQPQQQHQQQQQQQQTQAQSSAATPVRPAITTAPSTTAPSSTAATPMTGTPAVASSSTALPRATPSSTYSFPTYTRDSNLYGRSAKKGPSYRGLFTKELRNLMYGFGDDRNPANDTVNVMEEILIEYIVDVVLTASGGGKKSRLSIEDLRRALSRPADAKKLARMEELLFMQEDIKRARAQFDEPDMHPAGSNI